MYKDRKHACGYLFIIDSQWNGKTNKTEIFYAKWPQIQTNGVLRLFQSACFVFASSSPFFFCVTFLSLSLFSVTRVISFSQLVVNRNKNEKTRTNRYYRLLGQDYQPTSCRLNQPSFLPITFLLLFIAFFSVSTTACGHLAGTALRHWHGSTEESYSLSSRLETLTIIATTRVPAA